MTTNEYTPTTENIRRTWLDAYPEEFRGQGGAAFDRWLDTQTASGDYHEGWEEGFKAGRAAAPDHQAEAGRREVFNRMREIDEQLADHQAEAGAMTFDKHQSIAPDHQLEATSDRPTLVAELRKVAHALEGHGDRYEAGWVYRAIGALAARPVVDDAALRELVDRGVGFDLNPTMLIDTAHSVYVQWVEYVARLDAAWRDRVRAALEGDQ